MKYKYQNLISHAQKCSWTHPVTGVGVGNKKEEGMCGYLVNICPVQGRHLYSKCSDIAEPVQSLSVLLIF